MFRSQGWLNEIHFKSQDLLKTALYWNIYKVLSTHS